MLDDSVYLDRLKAGEDEAFYELVRLHQSRVINTCYRFMRNQQDAEDMAQDVFLEIYQSIDRFRGQCRLSTWIYRIAVTKSLDALRKSKRKKRMGHLKRILGYATDDGVETIEPVSPDTPVDALQQQERALILHQAMDSLPDNQRIALSLRQFDGFSYTEVAEIMETTVSAVESLLHRAKRNLEKTLGQYFEKKLD